MGDDAKERTGRGRAAGEMTQALRVIQSARTVAMVYAVASAVVLVILFLDYLDTRSLARPSGFALALVVFQAIQVVLMVAAYINVRRDVHRWVLFLAWYTTFVAVLHALDRGIPVIPMVFTGILWSGLPAAARAKRLVEEHPELRIAKVLQGEERKPRGVPPPKRERAHRLRERPAGPLPWWRRQAFVVTACMVIAAAVTVVAGRAMMAPSDTALDGEIRTLVTALEAGDLDALQALLPLDARPAERERLRSTVSVSGWIDRPPAVERTEVRDLIAEEASVRVWLKAGAGPFDTLWVRIDDRWRLLEITVP